MERSAQCRSSITSSRGQLGQADQQRQHPVEQLDPLEAVPGGAGPWSVASSGSSRPRLGTAAASGAATSASPGGCRGRGRRRRTARRAGRRRRPPCSRRPAPGPRGRRPGRRARRQPGLADAGVAGDQPDRRPPAVGPVEQAEQAVELFGPADEAGGGRGGHAGKYGPPADNGARPPLPLEDGRPASRRGRRPAAPGRRAGRRARRSRRPGGPGRGRRPGPASRAARPRPRWPTGWRPSGHPVADHVGQLAGVPAVRVDAAVGAVGDPHAGLDRLGEAVALGLGGGLVLGQRLGRPALAGPSVAM